ncbi:helix-turn-helix domain-containing protein [Arenibacter algicola]|jgi:transcriptional regulator with XRE-family HTH domain|uniref:helix-turn-helix domain-containing protein n=1 Tax=Arenibacter algicola TaxID=616991 RepID=UPI001C0771B8|nr:helix-turn-helix transcriptional regulator [Arenibacter algicola]MBU2905203.1 helix-turn-helix domain-containing protein [Arenibacter algicola]
MIQQPDLGKKIADLRKEKGLTQEELVAKCNLNVRTLQRIESGEVMPRTYTIRLIFEALDFSFDESNQSKGIMQKGLGQFYISFIQLFNLKTNTIKKISILTVMFFVFVFVTSSLFNISKAQHETKLVNTHQETSRSEETTQTDKFEIAGLFDGWNSDSELVGRDVQCIINSAIIIKSPLLKLNKETNEIRTPCYTGIIKNNTVIISNLKCQPIERIVNKVRISGDEFIYDGELVFSEKESIKAGKIIVPRD